MRTRRSPGPTARLRPGELCLDPRRRPRAAGSPPCASVRRAERPHPAGLRDAPRRLQAVRLPAKGSVDVFAWRTTPRLSTSSANIGLRDATCPDADGLIRSSAAARSRSRQQTAPGSNPAHRRISSAHRAAVAVSQPTAFTSTAGRVARRASPWPCVGGVDPRRRARPPVTRPPRCRRAQGAAARAYRVSSSWRSPASPTSRRGCAAWSRRRVRTSWPSRCATGRSSRASGASPAAPSPARPAPAAGRAHPGRPLHAAPRTRAPVRSRCPRQLVLLSHLATSRRQGRTGRAAGARRGLRPGARTSWYVWASAACGVSLATRVVHAISQRRVLRQRRRGRSRRGCRLVTG